MLFVPRSGKQPLFLSLYWERRRAGEKEEEEEEGAGQDSKACVDTGVAPPTTSSRGQVCVFVCLWKQSWGRFRRGGAKL